MSGAAADNDYKVYDGDNISFVYTNNSGIAAGTYNAVAALASSAPSSNYAINTNAPAGSNGSKTWKISPKIVTVSWNHSSPYVYNKTARTVSASVTNLESGDTAVLTIVNTGAVENGRYLNHTATNAGLYRAKITAVSNSNYTITGASNLYLDWQIDKADISGITMNDRTVTYSGEEYAISVSGNLSQYGDIVSVSYSITPQGSSSNGAINAGSYTVSATLTNQNYNSLTLQASLVINKASLSLSWKDFANGSALSTDNNPYSVVYSKLRYGKTLTVSGIKSRSGTLDEVKLTISFSNVSGEGSSTGIFVSGIATQVNNASYNFYATYVGSYSATVSSSLSGQHSGNYSLSSTSRAWVINAKVIEIGWHTDSLSPAFDSNFVTVYNGQTRNIWALPLITGIEQGSAESGVYQGDIVEITYAGTISAKFAGSYSATASSSNPNYSIDASCKTRSWQINKKVISVSWRGGTEAVWNEENNKLYTTYNGNYHYIVADITNIEPGDTIGITYGGTLQAADVNGDYVTTITAISNSNYTITGASNLSKTWYLKKRVISVSWSGDTSYNYNGLYQGVNLILGNIVSGDDDMLVFYMPTQTAQQIEGISPDYITGSVLSSYGTSLTPANTSINDTFTATRAGGTAGSYVELAFKARGIGRYTITDIILADNPNYELDDAETSFTWSIGPKTIALLWSGNGQVVYNADEQGVTLSVTGIENGDKVYFNLTVTGELVTNSLSDPAKHIENNVTYYFRPKTPAFTA